MFLLGGILEGIMNDPIAISGVKLIAYLTAELRNVIRKRSDIWVKSDKILVLK